MVKLSGRGSSRRLALRRLGGIFRLTIRQRISVYLVIAAIIALACGGVDYTVNANKMDGELTVTRIGAPIKDDLDCHLASSSCDSFQFVNGKCVVKGCLDPPDKPSMPVTNCGLGKTNGGAAWTAVTCQARVTLAGCSKGTLYSFGCYGYNCTKLQCGQ
ncbi:MAG TPA: hypothetical protein VH087_09605 [Thermoanaerobaculia bacterium]|jgi:hypothetical protein|nr:hypothetical protein [Thermoanaerobaculia bacterium]